MVEWRDPCVHDSISSMDTQLFGVCRKKNECVCGLCDEVAAENAGYRTRWEHDLGVRRERLAQRRKDWENLIRGQGREYFSQSEGE